MSARILIGGYYGHGNTGDEALLAAMLRELRSLRSDLSFIVASGDPDRTREEHGVDAVAATDLPALTTAIGGSELVIVGGGGLFQDYWSVPAETFLTSRQGGLYSYLVYPVLAALLERPVMIFAVGVGPLATEEGRRLTRAAFELCGAASVRDERSLALLKQIGIAGATLSADPAFLFESSGAPPLPEGEGPWTGVALRHWDFEVDPEVWEGEVARGLDLFLDRHPDRLLFVPLQSEKGEGRYEDDVAVSRRVAAALRHPERAVVLDEPPPKSVLPGLLGRCRRMLAMRFHAALFALGQGVPVAALAYDDKVTSLLEEAGQADQALPPASWRAEEVAAALSRAEPLPEAGAFLETMRARARWSARLALETLERGAPAKSPARRLLDETALEKIGAVLRLEADNARLSAALRAAEGELGVIAPRLREIEARLLQSEAGLAETRVIADEQERELEALRLGWNERGSKLEEAWAAHAGMRDQRDMMLRERNDMARRLGELEATVAYRAMSRFWSLMRRAFPEGSRRRELYRGGRTVVSRLLRLKPAASMGILGALPEDNPAPGEPDPRGDLLRFEEWVRARGAESVVVIFSATQLLESEGQRPTQLALELTRRGLPVVFCYWRWWPNEWCAQDRLEEGIVQIPIDIALARPDMVAGGFAGVPSRIALFEFPYPGFFEILAALNAEGWITVYDVLDDWAEFHRVGQAVWYDEPFERHLITATDAVFAINDFLADRVRELGGEGIGVVGNGLKPGLDVVRAERPLPRGEVTVGYFGYLAGAWFDWELVAEAARRRPSWKLYLIGYGGSPEGVELPDNVALLGKKPQGELAAFAAHWDVAIIPFKPDRLAAGADPIKTYEYLAMGLPVVATGVYPPAGGEAFVTRAEGVEDFLGALARAASASGGRAERKAFAATCTWAARLDALLEAVARGEQRVAEKRALAGPVPAGEAVP